MGWRDKQPTSHTATRTYLAILGVLVLTGVAITVYQYELGLASPSKGAEKAAYATAAVESTLESDADYPEFSTALRVAIVALNRMPVSNTTDNRIEHSVRSALDSYQLLREAWQVDLEGQWAEEPYGDPEYWRGFHPGIKLDGDAPMTAQEIRDAVHVEARAHLEDALILVTD